MYHSLGRAIFCFNSFPLRLHGREKSQDCWAAKLRARFHQHLRAEQSEHADEHAPVYEADKRLFKEGGES